jgi:hypothetical protein
LKVPSEISTDELGFWELEQEEFSVCRDYEFGREHVLGRKRAIDERLKAMEEEREAIDKETQPYSPQHLEVVYPDLKDLVAAVRRGWQVANCGFPFRAQNPNWFQWPASKVLVLYPDWPDFPYLSIPKAERLKRINRLALNPERAEDPMAFVARIQRELLKTDPNGEAGDERKSALLETLINLASLVQIGSGGAKRSQLIAIPTQRDPLISRSDVLASISALLTIQFPDLPSEKKRGRRSRPCDDLNALAVYRLRRAGKKLEEIKDSVREPGSGRSTARVYSSIGKLKAPLDRLPGRVAEFYRQVVADLEPVEPDIAPEPDLIPWPVLPSE